MKPKLLILCIVVTSALPAFSADLIPGICTFDPPANLQRGEENHDPGDSPFRMQSYAIRYTPKDDSFIGNNGTGTYRELNVSVRAVGMTIGEGKRVTTSPVSDDTLKQIMAEQVIAKNATNAPKVEETTFAGHKALKVRNVVPMPQVTPDHKTVFIFENIWVRVKPNQVLSVQKVALNDKMLETISEWLKTFKVLTE